MKFLKDSVRHKKDLRQRFINEARAACSLHHPNVVEILDVFDLEDRSPVIVMELLEGETLGEKLAREERLNTGETAGLMIPVIAAVGTAHARGIVHRDLKPENIFVVRGECGARVKVLDFGIAKLAAEHYLEQGQSVLETEAGAVLGTPCYMAPEQLTNDADYRADIWSLGVILYECLSGARPIEGRNIAEVIARLMTGAITPLDRLTPELPHDVTAIVQQMLARDVQRRPQDLTQLTEVLSRYTHVRVAHVESKRNHDASSEQTAAIATGPAGLASVEPQSATMPSAPGSPPASGIAPPTPESVVSALVRPRALFPWYVIAAAAALSALGLLGIFVRSRAHSGAAASNSAIAVPGEQIDAPLAGHLADTSSSMVTPPATAIPAPAPLVIATTKTTAAKATSPVRSSPTSAPTSRPRAAPGTRIDSNEDVLFSGRK